MIFLLAVNLRLPGFPTVDEEANRRTKARASRRKFAKARAALIAKMQAEVDGL